MNLFNSGVRDFLHYLEMQGMNPNERNYVFVDEMQYMEDPSSFLKLIADHHKNLKLICSGSSTLEVRRKFTDSLAGRKVVFEIPTLSFREYLMFKGEEPLLKLVKDYPFDDIGEPPLDIHRKQLQTHYEQYVIYGGYPAVVLENERERKLRLFNITIQGCAIRWFAIFNRFPLDLMRVRLSKTAYLNRSTLGFRFLRS